MLAGLEVPPAVEAERVITAVLVDLRSGSHRGVVVDSSPGAGESTLLVSAASGKGYAVVDQECLMTGWQACHQ